MMYNSCEDAKRNNARPFALDKAQCGDRKILQCDARGFTDGQKEYHCSTEKGQGVRSELTFAYFFGKL